MEYLFANIKGLKKGTIVPTTHLANYKTTNGYGNVVDRSQIVENDAMYITYNMIDKVFAAYMDSLANIIIAHSPESIIKLFMENINNLSLNSEIHEKVAAYIDGYKMPEDICKEIANQVKINGPSTTIADIDKQINELAKTICPFYISNGKLNESIEYKVKAELKKLHPDSEALKSGGCYVATAVYGSYDCPQVWTLRRYRDYTLAETRRGRAFIKTYYAISPTLVKWFGHTKWFKKMWKGKLDRMVENLRSEGVKDTPYEDKNW